MARITFEDKEAIRQSDLPAKNVVSAGDLNEIKNSVNAIYDNPETSLGYEKTVITVTAEQFLEFDTVAVDLKAAPGAGKFYDWFAYVIKNSDGYFNLLATDQIFIGSEDYTNGALIYPVSINNSLLQHVLKVSPSPIFNVSNNLTYKFGVTNQKLIFTSYTGAVPNVVTCSVTIMLYTKVIDTTI